MTPSTAVEILLKGDSSTEESAAISALALSPAEEGMLRLACGMKNSDARGIALGRSAQWLILTGDPTIGIEVSRALLEYWKARSAPPSTREIWPTELADALVCIAQGHERLGHCDAAIQIARVEAECVARVGGETLPTRLAIVAADAAIGGGDYEKASQLLPKEPANPQLRIQWARVKKRLDRIIAEASGEPSPDIRSQWEAAIDSVFTTLEGLTPPAALNALRGRFETERASVPKSEHELLARINALMSALQPQ